MTANPRIFTRRELYDLIWSTPMSKLAEEFGISDRGLAKICERHRVTGPTRGYWAKLVAGKKVKQSIFREVDDVELNRIVISPTLSSLPPQMEAVIEAARAERKSRLSPAVPAAELPALVPIEKPHRTISATARALRKDKDDDDGAVRAFGEGLCGVLVHRDHAERAISFLHTLATALEDRGLALKASGQSMKIEVGPDDVTFKLSERTRREKHKPTEAELEAYQRQKEKRARAVKMNAWDTLLEFRRQEPWPEFDTVYTGEFVFAVDGCASGLRRTWADGKTQTVERLLPDIVTGLEVILAYYKNSREEREERNRQWADMERRRDLAGKRAAREKKRIEYIRGLVELQREASDIRSWIASLPPGSSPEANSDLARMLAWAQARLVRLDASTTIDAAAALLDGRPLFPEHDDLSDPLGDPPEPKPHSWY